MLKGVQHVLQAFDDLLLLKSGGVVTYHGSLGKNSCRLIEYFQVSLPPCLLLCRCPTAEPHAAKAKAKHLYDFSVFGDFC